MTPLVSVIVPILAADREAARQLIDRFCGGSARELLVGMVDNQVIKPNELKKLAEEIASRKEKKA